MDLLEEKVTKKRVNITDYFPEFEDVAEVRKLVDRFGGDPFNLTDVKSFILYLFQVCSTLDFWGTVFNYIRRIK